MTPFSIPDAGESEEELAEEEAVVMACHKHCEVPYCSRACMDQVLAEGLTTAKEFTFGGEAPVVSSAPAACGDSKGS